jgi:CBS domain containing-hemolysin-like protein
MLDFILGSSVIFLSLTSALLSSIGKSLSDGLSLFEIRRRIQENASSKVDDLKKDYQLLKNANLLDAIGKILAVLLISLAVLISTCWIYPGFAALWPLLAFLTSFIFINNNYANKLQKKIALLFLKNKSLIKFIKPILKHSGVINNSKDNFDSNDFVPIANSSDELAAIIQASKGNLKEEFYYKMIRSAESGSITISSIVVKIEDLPKIDQSAELTPAIYNELYEHGLNLALVYNSKPENVIGVLYFGGPESLAQIKSLPMVKDRMEVGLEVVQDTLRVDDAVMKLLDTRHTVLIVKNKANKIIGIVSVKQLLAHQLGLV